MRKQLSFLSAAILAALLSASSVATEAPTLWLEIGGSADLPFTARCRVEGDGGRETVTLDERVPYRRGFAARTVNCEIEPRSRGRFVVTLRNDRGNSISRSAITAGPGTTIRMSVSR
jgi:hypothetical protein